MSDARRNGRPASPLPDPARAPSTGTEGGLRAPLEPDPLRWAGHLPLHAQADTLYPDPHLDPWEDDR